MGELLGLGFQRDLFDKKENPPPTLLETKEQKVGKQYLSDYVSDSPRPRYAGPYPGQLSADKQPYEGLIPGLTTDYVNRNTPLLQKQSQDVISNTLLGKYDPYNSDYYKAYREGAQKNLEDAQTLARQSAQIGGMLRSTGRLNTENKLIRDTTNDLNQTLANLQLQERQNQLNVIPQAVGLSQYEENAPLRSLAAIFSSGEYETGLEQSALDRLYNDYVRQLNEEKYPLQVAQTLANPGLYEYYQKTFQPSKFTEYVVPLLQAGAQAAAASSDKRLKKNIVKIGKMKNGINIYKWQWKDFAKKFVNKFHTVGVLAQEVIKIKPDAVFKARDGYLMVNYSMLGE